MAGKATAAPIDEADAGDAAAEGNPASGSFFGRLIGKITGMSRMKMMIFGGVLLVLIGGGAYAMFFMGGDKKPSEAAAPKTFHHELPEMMVNLSAGNDRPQYLRVKITLELENEKTIEALKPALPRVVDTFQIHLRELRASDLQGSAGLFRLREELTRRVNHAIAPAKIRAVLFREVVVQ
jgi:flagellar protein FliL